MSSRPDASAGWQANSTRGARCLLPTRARLEGNSSCSFNFEPTGAPTRTAGGLAEQRLAWAVALATCQRTRGSGASARLCQSVTEPPLLPSGRACVSSVSRRARMSVAVYQWHHTATVLVTAPHPRERATPPVPSRRGSWSAGRGRRACRPPRETRLALGGRSVHRERKGNPGASGRRWERAHLCGILPPYW